MRNHSQPMNSWESLRDEQLERWRKGDCVTIEQLQSERPDDFQTLGEEGLLDLIYGEILLREEAGQQSTVDQFIQRFPSLADAIGRQFTVHEALSESSLWPTMPQQPDITTPTFASQQTSEHSSSAKEQFSKLPPDYEMLGEIGRGGMSVVYKAKHRTLKRYCALKMLRDRALAAPGHRERFRVEAEAVAKLQHPNIVQIYDCGEFEGTPYLSLEYLEGGTLDAWTRPPLHSVEDCIRLVDTLAGAVAHAHAQGIIHRDLKPANILLGSESETVKITDFGLAKNYDNDLKLTHSEAIVGTAAYLAPEQAWGRSSDVGPQTDVHALGILLYELLTGVSPFSSTSFARTLDLVRFHCPCVPSELRPGVSQAIDAVCLRCLEKEPSQRYASAQVLSDDLQRILAHGPLASPSRSAQSTQSTLPTFATHWRWLLAAAIASLSLAMLVLLRKDIFSQHGMVALQTATSGGTGLQGDKASLPTEMPDSSIIAPGSESPSLRTQPSTFAFLVGVRSYGEGDHRFDLSYTESDVDELSRLLLKLRVPRSNIHLLTQWSEADNPDLSPSAENVRRRLKKLMSETIPGDTILIAVTGMGGESGLDGDYCYLPANAQLDQLDSMIPLGEFYDLLAQGRASQKVLLIDTCQSTSIPDFQLTKRSPPADVAVLFACGPGEASLEHDSIRHGVFSYQVLRGLEGAADLDRDGIVAIGELHAFTQRGVRDFLSQHAPEVEQTPTLVGAMDPRKPVIGPLREP
ncbi:MAG: protein kinase [Pirellulales bacterium]